MDPRFYLNDILSQPAELNRAMAYYQTQPVWDTLNSLHQLNAKKVVFSGMGSSHFCSFGASILLKQHGIDSQVISTGELLYYERGSLNSDAILCLISQSGESAEIKHLLELLDPEVFVIALTNNAQSTLGKRGNVTFLMNVSDEISVTTRTYVSSLVMTQLIAAALSGDDTAAVMQEFRKAVAAMDEWLQQASEYTAQLRKFFRGSQSISLMGRGNSLSTVRSGALFFREVSKFTSVDYDSAEFRHGPMELVQDGFYSIVFAPTGLTQSLGLSLAQSINDKGGKVLLVTDDNGLEIQAPGILTMVMPQVSEYASPLLQILPVQLLANSIAEDKGIPAGVFRWGSKITAAE